MADTLLVIHTIDEMRREVAAARSRGLTVGFVPTMGALHAGHAALVRQAVEECGFVVVSIFVNPLQFGPNEDYERYPRTLDQDVALLREVGAHAVFAPSVNEMYPLPQLTFVEVEKVTEGLCGASRPGHFRGVATVVTKLFNIVTPDVAYFGQKDAQQAAVIRTMVRDLSMPVEIRVCPTVREEDGLAVSSRNTYLSPEERKAATVLYRALGHGKALIESGERDAARVRGAMRELIESEPLARVDYCEVVDAESLAPVSYIEGNVLLAVAAYFGSTRLIDNMAVEA